MAKKKKQSKSNITVYRKPLNINLGMIIFAVILIYIIYSVARFMTAKHVVGYEVRTGSITADRIYEGVAVREEEIAPCTYAGYINYFTAEGDRLAANKLAYSIDPSGNIAEKLNSGVSNNEIFTNTDYSMLRENIIGFTSDFSAARFSKVYDFRDSMKSAIQKITNSSILGDIANVTSRASLHLVNTENTGYILYSTDGYEDKTFETLTAPDFDYVNYKKVRKELINNALVSPGDPAYRMVTGEDWSIVIPLSGQEEALALEEEGVIKVRFLKNQYESWATVTTRSSEDGEYYANLAFTNSVITFSTDRFITVQLLTDEQKGLKIPKSALIDDNFFVIPPGFATDAGGSKITILKQVVTANGEKTSDAQTITPYSIDSDGNYYLSKTDVKAGDVLLRTDSNETFQVAQSAKLTGVYNINKGYADFRQVSKISENDEYAIVKPDSIYGLREYDYIVLDASTMNPNEFIYSN